MEQTQLRFARGSASRADLQDATNRILAELDDMEPGVEIVVKDDGQALDPLTAGILIGIAGNVASHILIKLWETRVWPRLRDELGDDALGPPEDGD